MIDLDLLKKLNRAEQIAVTEHTRQRLSERKIAINDIIKCIETGEIIKQYENDKPFPSCLILGMSADGHYLHAVVSHDDEFIYLITAYQQVWESDFKTRRERPE